MMTAGAWTPLKQSAARRTQTGPSEQRALSGVDGLSRVSGGPRLFRRRFGELGAVRLVQRRRVVGDAIDRGRDLVDLHRACGRGREQGRCHLLIDVAAIEPEI